MKDKLRVIVCGTTFGQFYLEALAGQADFILAGILASGSERSKRCAEQQQVPLYTDFEQLPDDIDLACVVLRSSVLGGGGTDLAVRFMERKVHVIQEHPIHPKELERAYISAKKNGVFYKTGNLYANLPEVRKFAACAGVLNRIQKPAYINAAFAAQVSYPAFDILAGALPSIREWTLDGVHKGNGPFHLITGRLGGIPATFEIHNEVYPKDPDNHMYLMHNLMFVYESGRLSLHDTFGPVIWNPRMHVSTQYYGRGSLKGEFPDYMDENTSIIIGDYQPASYRTVLTEQWTKAILGDLYHLKGWLEGGSGYLQNAQKELLTAAKWNEITKALGYADIIDNCVHQAVSAEMLQAAVKDIH